jgi:hypothetical protein
MSTFRFSLVVEGTDLLAPERLDALFEAGCDDATLSVPEALVIRVEPDELVTAAEIAQALGRSRESVRLLIFGKRGPGGFPAPASHLRSRGRLWRWGLSGGVVTGRDPDGPARLVMPR